ncbi:MAG: OmpA family protein [Prevotellaceae bacterium]|nr:OmpA family protein [Prevotellaceae bacterium]
MLLILAATMSSCSTSFKIKRANKFFNEGAYAKASDRYRKVLPKVPREQQPPILFNLAEAHRLTGNARQAEGYYERVTTRSNTNPAVYLGLAMSQQTNENYEKAITSYEKYLALVPQDSMVKSDMEFCKALSDTATLKRTRYLVENMAELNSNKDDFAPAFAEDDYSILFFTSSREAAFGKKTSIITGDKSTDIFSATQLRTGKWQKPVPIQGEINTKNDEGTCALTRNYRTMYFTQCLTKGKIGCALMTSNYDADSEKWVEVESATIGDSTVNLAHPSLSEDGVELYFTSDMPGGYGGTDIWMASRVSDGDGWGEPVNLGPNINTEGNEMYPYIRNNGALYFSSDGHKGFGGLDLFKATKRDIGGWHVDNMGIPINSNADDFSIIFEREREAGYFSSRRRGGRGGDDIYRFVLPESRYMFIGAVKNFDDLSPINEANVNIISSSTGESQRQRTGADGIINITLSPETDYLVIVTKKEYFNQKSRFSTKGLEGLATLRDEFIMRSMAKAIELENILYDFGKWNLRPESEESLNQLVEIMNDNPGISIEVMSHSDSRGDSIVNMRVSQRRAQSVVDYLVAHGIGGSRLQAVGKGESDPRVVTPSIAAQYKFLRVGDILNDTFMKRYVQSKSEEEIVDQLNRRTEFKVISEN